VSVEHEARLHAAELQERLGFQVSSATSNDWRAHTPSWTWTRSKLSPTASRSWVKEHIDKDAQTWGHALVMELRYAEDIIKGLDADGLLGVLR